MTANMSNLPGSPSFTITPNVFPIGHFCWTPPDTSTSPYFFVITLTDTTQCPVNALAHIPVYISVSPFTRIDNASSRNSIQILYQSQWGNYLIKSDLIKIRGVRVTNIIGELIFESKNSNEFNLNNSPPGIYLVDIELENGKRVVKKLSIK